MSQTKRLDLESLKSAIASYVASEKIALTSLSVTTNNVVGLADTIGKIYTIDTSVYDKLPELEGTSLSFGKTVEEWQQDMSLPVSYDADEDGNKALKTMFQHIAQFHSQFHLVVKSSQLQFLMATLNVPFTMKDNSLKSLL